MLYYIRNLPESKLHGLKSAADVYYLAIYELIKRGMEKSAPARQMGCSGEPPEKVQDRAILLTFQLLSRIAFDMASRKINVQVKDASGETQWAMRPNFYRVARGKMPALIQRLEDEHTNNQFGRDWDALSALNTVLSHAVFDANVGGLVEIEFRNRSLQEFLCAYYLSQHAWPEGKSPQDVKLQGANDRLADMLWQWIYLPFDAESEDYYYVWQFLCDMPDDATNDDVWLESVAPLFRQAIKDDSGQWIAKRSNEMIFRSWRRMSRLCHQQYPRAVQIRDQWWSEFEDVILAGGRDNVSQRHAKGLKNSFVTIPDGTFTMGSPKNRQRELAEHVS